MMEQIRFAGDVVLVTGGAHGIGRAIAQLFLACGARVIINDLDLRKADSAATELGGDVLALAADVADESAVNDMMAAALDKWGRLDSVVNNAGIAAPVRPTFQQDMDTWQRVMDVNLKGAYLVSRAAGQIMAKQGRGAIVNVTSLAGICPMPASNDYGVSKAALVMLTQTLAAEWGRLGIRVNAVAPGFTNAPMLHETLASTKVEEKAYLRRIALGRFGEADEIARAVVFLTSVWASYITGAVLPVDGGWSANAGP